MLFTGLVAMFAVVVAAAPVAPGDVPAGFRRRATYVHLSPGILAFDVEDLSMRYYAWGVGGGPAFPFGRAGLITVGGFFEHLVFRAPPVFRTTIDGGPDDHQLFCLGPELRLGGSSERVFGYGLVRVGLDLYYEPPPRRELLAGFVTTLGAGVQGLVSRHIVIGAEPAIDLLRLNGNNWLFRARIFVGVLF